MTTTTTATVYVDLVVDGDTFRTSAGEYIRLADVCAPELAKPGGTLARQRLANAIQDKYVEVQTVGMSYGRFVCEVWRKSDSLWINAYMRALGYTCG